MPDFEANDDELKLLRAIASALSDYRMALQHKEFADMHGGVAKLQANLFSIADEYEKWVDEGERDS